MKIVAAAIAIVVITSGCQSTRRDDNAYWNGVASKVGSVIKENKP